MFSDLRLDVHGIETLSRPFVECQAAAIRGCSHTLQKASLQHMRLPSPSFLMRPCRHSRQQPNISISSLATQQFVRLLSNFAAGLAGTYAGYMSVPEKQLARMPSSLSFEEAGSMPLVATTAYQVLAGARMWLPQSFCMSSCRIGSSRRSSFSAAGFSDHRDLAPCCMPHCSRTDRVLSPGAEYCQAPASLLASVP